MELRLVRDQPGPDCTLGVLFVENFQCQTLELPWVPIEGSPGGHPFRSCVPVGLYKLLRHNSPKHPFTWALVNHDLDIYEARTDGKRDDCLLHTGNKAADSLGCIVMGSSRQRVDGQWEVLNSRPTFALIKSLVPWDDSSTLEIT